MPKPRPPIYSPLEIAQAAGVSEAEVLAVTGRYTRFVRHEDAVRIGRSLRHSRSSQFSLFTNRRARPHSPELSLAVSTTFHAAMFALLLLTAVGTAPARATAADVRAEAIPLVFVALPGPGGGGGGGGAQQRTPPPRAERDGHRSLSSPLPRREPAKPIQAAPEPPPPPPDPVDTEPLPPVVAPVAPVAADPVTHPGVLEQAPVESDSRGPGNGGGAGSGIGQGLGEGEGDGIGPGSGGGTGGGPYRPGSGIEPPSLLREVKAGYTEDARIRQLEGEVVLEVVVRRDGSVGDLKVLRGLGGGLNERAAEAVRQWRFSPARRKGVPVDVLVEVAVEFKLR
jgi:TonB family protein